MAVATLIIGVGRLGDITDRRRLLLPGIFGSRRVSVLRGVATMLLAIYAYPTGEVACSVFVSLTLEP
jgi:hypothetical protein